MIPVSVKILIRYATLLPLALLLQASSLFAEGYRCELGNNGYNIILTQMRSGLTQKQKLDWIEGWLPSIFIVTPEKLMLWKNYHVDITGGDRVTSFQASTRSKSGQSHLAYDIKIEPHSGNGSVFLTPIGPSDNFKRIGPARYLCTSIGGSTSTKSSASTPFQQEFSKLTNCQKQYVQIFLKGQTFYDGAIDGLWGVGTAEGLRKARQLSEFKNLTAVQMFQKLKVRSRCF